jgi:hypothetical protein
MFILLGFSLLQAAANAPAPAAATVALCAKPAWREAFPAEGLVCVASQHGVAIGLLQRAREVAPIIDEAAARYAKHFGPPGKPMAVISSGSVSGPQIEFLRQQGFLAFPWMDRAATAPQGTPAPADAANRPAQDSGVVAHELGHIWFKEWYDAARPRKPGERHYGSTAPDWLDETAAILNENDYLTAQRRSGLADLLDGEGPGLWPIPEFLTMTHPTANAARAALRLNLPPGTVQRADGAFRLDPNNLPPGFTRRPDGSITFQGPPRAPGDPPAPANEGTMMLTVPGKADPEAARTGLRFYIQGRAFTDFLMEKSGNVKIIAEIATAMRGGGSFEQWLAAAGERHRLPSSLAGLTAAWEAWLKGKAAGG